MIWFWSNYHIWQNYFFKSLMNKFKFVILIKLNKDGCINIGSTRVVILIIISINYNAHSIVVFSKCKDIVAWCYTASRLFLINSNNNCHHNTANFDRIFWYRGTYVWKMQTNPEVCVWKVWTNPEVYIWKVWTLQSWSLASESS